MLATIPQARVDKTKLAALGIIRIFITGIQAIHHARR
jgi:hypothetical protein